MSDDLEQEFDRIRKCYFSEWEDGGNWKIREYDGRGYCDLSTKTIKVGAATENYSLSVLIIHEICHAVTSGDHDDTWANRMLAAAARADDVQFADELRQHVLWVMCPNAEDVTEGDVYQKISDAVVDQPNACYEEVVGWVANELGQDLESFEKYYPKARERFEQAYRPE